MLTVVKYFLYQLLKLMLLPYVQVCTCTNFPIAFLIQASGLTYFKPQGFIMEPETVNIPTLPPACKNWIKVIGEKLPENSVKPGTSAQTHKLRYKEHIISYLYPDPAMHTSSS